MIKPMASCGELLEEAGYTVMRKEAPSVTGEKLRAAGKILGELATMIQTIKEGDADAELCSQRLAFAAEKLTEAGNELKPTKKASWRDMI